MRTGEVGQLLGEAVHLVHIHQPCDRLIWGVYVYVYVCAWG